MFNQKYFAFYEIIFFKLYIYIYLQQQIQKKRIAKILFGSQTNLINQKIYNLNNLFINSKFCLFFIFVFFFFVLEG